MPVTDATHFFPKQVNTRPACFATQPTENVRPQNIKYKEKAQRTAAHERKLQKRRDRKARDLALFATWRETGPAEETADAVVHS